MNPAQDSHDDHPSSPAAEPAPRKARKTRALSLSRGQKRGVLVFVLAVAALLIWLYGAQAGHAVTRGALSFWPSVVLVILGVAAAIPAARRSRSSAVGWSVLGVTVAVAILFVPLVQSFLRGQVYAKSVRVTSEAPTDFKPRPPFDVASALSSRSLGDTTGDASGIIKSSPATSSYSTTVIRRGLFMGNESAQVITPPLNGTASDKDVSFCEFSEQARLRFGGAVPANNLARAIAWKTSPATGFHEDDALTVCDASKTPITYVPLVQLSLFPVPHDVPAGVAVYNGKTGELRIEKELTSDLPLYPKSLATAQRESSKTSGGFIDWIFKRAGWEDTSVDAGDPNDGNRAEFALASTDGTAYFVTPLTPRGSSSSIVALGEIRASGTVTAGRLNEYAVHRLEPARQANSTVATRITTENLDSYKATGLTVFEIVPGEKGSWVASIGKDQNILYRAAIRPDGTITLTGRAPNTQPPAASGVLKGDVGSMSEEELRQAINQLLDELQKRAAK